MLYKVKSNEIIFLFFTLFHCRDCLLSILNSLTENNNLHALRECRRPELCLNATLHRHLQNLRTEEAVDEVELCNNLLDRIFADHSNVQDR